MHIEMAQQLVPAVRLDGYYVLADLAGVPDLFARVGPVLRSLRPGAHRPARDRIAPHGQTGGHRMGVLRGPHPARRDGVAAVEPALHREHEPRRHGVQARQFESARSLGDLTVMALSIISLLLLAVPLLGLAVLIHRLARALWRLLHTGRRARLAPSDVPSDQEDPMATETRADAAATPVTAAAPHPHRTISSAQPAQPARTCPAPRPHRSRIVRETCCGSVDVGQSADG